MAMDPKQERVLRDGTASEADQPRRTDRESIRAQAERPPVEERPRPRRRTAAVGDIRVNLPSGTPVERFARESGAEPVPELGRTRNAVAEDETEIEAPTSTTPEAAEETNRAPLVDGGEARRVMKARREHSKGDGNFPKVEPGPELIDEREEDRTPRDLPKSRDDRSAPKGNVSAGPSDRNPVLEVRDDSRPIRPRPARPAPAAATTRTAKTQKRKMRTGASTRARGKKAGAPKKNSRARAQSTRGTKKPPTKRAVRRGGPSGKAGATRGGKR